MGMKISGDGLLLGVDFSNSVSFDGYTISITEELLRKAEMVIRQRSERVDKDRLLKAIAHKAAMSYVEESGVVSGGEDSYMESYWSVFWSVLEELRKVEYVGI